MLIQVGAAGACHVTHRSHAPCYQRGILQFPDPDRHVEAFLYQVDVAIVQVQVQLDAGVFAEKIDYGAGQVQNTKGQGGGQLD